MKKIYIQHPYLTHLLFGSNLEECIKVFDKVTPHVHSGGRYLNAQLILQSLVMEAFRENVKVQFPYKEEITTNVLSSNKFQKERKYMVEDILRVYEETQKVLSNQVNKERMLISRCLRGYEYETKHTFKEGESVTIRTNYLTSFSSERSKARPYEFIANMSKEKILFWENLEPMIESGGSLGLKLENEVIVKDAAKKIEGKIGTVDDTALEMIMLEELGATHKKRY
ncbi:TPA: hypothetical protein ACWWCX_002394 [Enterococcus faecium]